MSQVPGKFDPQIEMANEILDSGQMLAGVRESVLKTQDLQCTMTTCYCKDPVLPSKSALNQKFVNQKNKLQFGGKFSDASLDNDLQAFMEENNEWINNDGEKALLLPAVQKAREAARSPSKDGKSKGKVEASWKVEEGEK